MKFLLVFGLCLQLFAKSDCAEILQNALNSTQNRAETVRLAQIHVEKIQEINLILQHSEELRMPENLSLNFNAYELGPNFSLFDNVLTTGGRFASFEPGKTMEDIVEFAMQGGEIRAYTKHPNYSVAVTAHELGHGILEETMRSNYPAVRDIADYYNEFIEPLENIAEEKANQINRIIDRVNDRFARIRERWGDNHIMMMTRYEEFISSQQYMGAERQVERLKSEIDLIVAEIRTNADQVLDRRDPHVYVLTNGLFTPHHELFADLTALVSERNFDPEIISRSLLTARDHQRASERYVRVQRNRNFAAPQNEFQEWEAVSDRDLHGMFAPVRHFLYDEFLRFPSNQTPEKVGQILDIVYQSIREDYDTMILNPLVYQRLSARDRNERLLVMMSRRFLEAGF